jgi:hypothetical protein
MDFKLIDRVADRLKDAGLLIGSIEQAHRIQQPLQRDRGIVPTSRSRVAM